MKQGAGSGEGERLVFLDLARCTAIVLMVVAHFVDTFLSAEARHSATVELYWHIRGVTAPVFFLVSGWSFAVATFPRLAAFRRLGPEVLARVRRALVLFAWGYALTLPWWAEGFPFSVADQWWGPFATFGVLQCVATALLVSQLLLRVSAGPRSFAALAVGLAIALVAFAPWIQPWAQALPRYPAGALHAWGIPGGFPLAPWAAYFLVGAGVGALNFTARWSARRIAAGAALVAVLAFASSRALEPSFIASLGEWFAATSPSRFLHRMGMGAVVIMVVALASLKIPRLPVPLRRASRHALTFYVGHMLVVWGVPLITGLAHRLPKSLGLSACALLALACILAIWAALSLATEGRERFSSWRARRAGAVPTAG